MASLARMASFARMSFAASDAQLEEAVRRIAGLLG